ncbi:protein RRNAD1 isoform X2 [Neltuma alba]|nr:protein RRNAD1 isoform X2 [Prosopis alba]
MVLHRERADIQRILPSMQMTSLNSVLAQGMNLKKKHEVEILSAVVSSIANSVRAHTIIDVGAGQGYLAQVLSFQYHHSVVAIDACSHHGSVTNERAERIKKYYAAQMRKSASGVRDLEGPKTITSRVLSTDILKNLTEMSLRGDDDDQLSRDKNHADNGKLYCPKYANGRASLVLAGLHACGDLSVTMLKTFLECKEVKAVVSIGCCYNLLSEERFSDAGSQCGYPMSHALRSTGSWLGKRARDLACQSAERWRSLEMDAGIHNFELHTFRAAFQVVLSKYYPELMMNTPSIGRKGKALRRRHQRRAVEPERHLNEITSSLATEPAGSETDGILGPALEIQALPCQASFNERARCEQTKFDDGYSLFKNFCESGLEHLGIRPSHNIDFQEIWKEAEPFADLVGPYWTLRAALGPLLETLILLDRLLFLQEQGSVLETYLVPIFDPSLSPRNMAIIAKKIGMDLES